jgi:ribonuclease HI
MSTTVVEAKDETTMKRSAMSVGFIRRALGALARYTLAMAMFIIGSMTIWWGIGIVPIIIGLVLILPREAPKAILHTAGVAHHEVGDPRGPAGVGAVLRSESGELIGEISKSIGMTTNTVADYSALAAGLEMALEKGVEEINIYVDSAVVAGHLVDGYRVRADHLLQLAEQVRQLLESFQMWSLARSPRRLNVEADQLANLAINEAVGEGPYATTRSITPVQILRRGSEAA